MHWRDCDCDDCYSTRALLTAAGDAAVSRCVDGRYHEDLKSSLDRFLAETDRLPHHQHDEAIADGLLFRNCRRCPSTLAFELDVPRE